LGVLENSEKRAAATRGQRKKRKVFLEAAVSRKSPSGKPASGGPISPRGPAIYSKEKAVLLKNRRNDKILSFLENSSTKEKRHWNWL